MEGLNISVPAVEKLCSDTVSDVMMNDELYIIFQIYQWSSYCRLMETLKIIEKAVQNEPSLMQPVELK